MTISPVAGQLNTATATGIMTLTITLPSGITLGNLVVAELGFGGGATGFAGPSGWTQAGSGVVSSGGVIATQIWYLVVDAGHAGQTSFAFGWTGGGNGNAAYCIREWNSTTGWQASPVDKSSTGNTSGTTLSTGTTATTTQASELWVASLCWGDTGQTESNLTAGFTSGQLATVTSASCREAYKIVSTTGAALCQETLGTFEQTACEIATFMPAAGGNPAGTEQPLPTVGLARRARGQILAWAGFSPRAGGQGGTTRPVPKIQPVAAQPVQRARGPRVTKDSWIQVSSIPAGNTTATGVTSTGQSGSSYGGVAVHYTLNLGNPAATWMHRTGGRRADKAIASSQTANSQTANPSVVGGTGMTQRDPRQRSRAVIGNGVIECAGGQKGQIQPATFKLPSLTLLFIPRRYPARIKFGPYQGIVGGFAGSLQPRPPPTQIPSSAVPPRRKSSRALVGNQLQPYGGIAVPPVAFTGTRQPRGTVPVPRRYPSRALTRSVAGQTQPKPSVQPRATIPVPRRYPSRAGFWAKIAGLIQPGQFIQPRPTVPLPRRYPSRLGFWRTISGVSTAYPAGTQQPRPVIQPPRRYPSRAVTRSGAGAVPPGHFIQPRPTAPIQRRYPARLGLWRNASGTAVSYPAGTVQPRATIAVPRRNAARAGFWEKAAGTAGTANQAGTLQPRPTLPPRRTSARAVTAHAAGQVQAGQFVQPRPTVPLPRRASARILTAHSAPYQGQVPGKVQPRATVPVPRRYRARAGFWESAAGKAANVGAGVLQPRASVPVPRRYPARAGLWHSVTGTVSTTVPQDVTWFTGPPQSGWVTGSPYSRTWQTPGPRSGWTENEVDLQ